MCLYSFCDLAADFARPERGVLGYKPPKPMLSKRAEGFVFGQKFRSYLVKPEDRDGHILVVGGAGSGKSRYVAIPSIQAWRRRVFAIDIKGELAAKAGDYRPSLKIFNPLKPDACGYDPFFLLSRGGNLAEDMREVVFAIVPKPAEIKDPFWVDGARNLLTGALLHYHHLGYSFIDVMNTVQHTPVLELLAGIRESGMETARLFVNQFAGMDVKTISGVFAELSNHIMVFATDQAVRASLSKPRSQTVTPFDLEKGFDIFLQIPEDKLDQWKPLVSMMVNQFLKHFERRPDSEAEPVLFLLDEFPRLGKMEVINGLATLRSKKITICLIVQSLAQLEAIYGRDQRKIIVDNCAYKAILSATDAETQEYFSRLVGTYERARVSSSRSFEGEDTEDVKGSSRTEAAETVRIIKPERFATLTDIVLLTPYGFCRAQKAR
jgi:type IV secretion system protein VirD4